MTEALSLFVSILLLLLSTLTTPTTATCPTGMHEEVLTRAGYYLCRHAPIGGENEAPVPPGYRVGRIYCTGGSVPVVINHQTVGCTR